MGETTVTFSSRDGDDSCLSVVAKSYLEWAVFGFRGGLEYAVFAVNSTGERHFREQVQ